MSKGREILDDLSGFEFEQIIADIYRNKGYQNVKVQPKTGDEGKDIIMEKPTENTTKKVIIECKHKNKVSRPVVQKLHSAATTHQHNGPKKGKIVTSGRFTEQAKDYKQKINQTQDIEIEFINGEKLIEMGKNVGLDLYNEKVEIICDKALYYPTDKKEILDIIEEQFSTIKNYDPRYRTDPEISIEFQPHIYVSLDIDAKKSTSVGVIDKIDKKDTFVLKATKENTKIKDGTISQIARQNLGNYKEINEDKIESTFDDIEYGRFGKTHTEYKDWIYENAREKYTRTVTYEGDNNQEYTQTWRPKREELQILKQKPLYAVYIDTKTSIMEYSYNYKYLATPDKHITREDGIHKCIQCGSTGGSVYTFCKNCGSINCDSHIKTERIEDSPVCTGCAVTERFFLKKKYFYNQENLEEFRERYEKMPPYEKVLENKPLIVLAIISVIVILAYIYTQLPI